MNNKPSHAHSEVRENQMSTKPRVLFIVGFLGGGEGIAAHLVTLSKKLIEQGWEVALASAMVEESRGKREIIHGPKWYESHGVKHFFVPFPDFRLSSKNLVSAFRALLKLNTVVDRFKPDVIHVHSLSLCLYIQSMRLWHKIPFVSTCHLEPRSDRLVVKLGAVANKWGFHKFFGNRVIAISSELKHTFEQTMKVPQENIRLVFHGIEKEYFRPASLEERLEARKALDLSPESKIVCLIGRLAYIKGHDVLFRAISLLKSDNLDVIALCPGRGTREEEKAIRAHIIEIGISDSICLPGFVDARQVLWASDVIVLPSRREGFGLVIPEAMLCGVVPVRTPAAGAFDQIEDGANGFIVPFDDPEALALRLQQLLENDNLRSQMSAAALESAQRKFTADRMTKDTIAVYEEVINEGVAGKNL